MNTNYWPGKPVVALDSDSRPHKEAGFVKALGKGLAFPCSGKPSLKPISLWGFLLAAVYPYSAR